MKGYQEELRNLELEWKTQAYATKQSMAMEHETAIRAMEQSIASLTAQLAASTAINEVLYDTSSHAMSVNLRSL